MFTGIIEEIGKIKSVKSISKHLKIEINAKKVLEGTVIGDSIAVNGACLTVSDLGKDYFIADMVEETVTKVTPDTYSVGKYVNLERALTLNKRLGGHILQGHVDCTGNIVEIVSKGDNFELLISYPEEFSIYTVNKGSISIDGISLTIAEKINKNILRIAIIPHTYENVILKYKNKGDKINIEFDILGKYIYNIYMAKEENEKDNNLIRKLKENGFYGKR